MVMDRPANKHTAQIVMLILIFIPIVIWLFIEPLQYRFFDLNSTTTSLGQLAGLTGMTLFSLNLILSSRLKTIEKLFLGLGQVYKNHKIVGAIAFSLILFHPLLLVIKYLQVSLNSAAMFLIPSQNLANTFGIIALLLLIVLMVFTFYIKLKYRYWKISHKFMTVVFIFALIHMLLVTSDTSRSPLLLDYILILATVGLVGSIRQAFFRKLIIEKK